MGYSIRGRLSTDTRPTDFTTIRLGQPRVTAAVVDPDPARSSPGVVHPPARGDLILTAPVRETRTLRVNTARAMAGYDHVTSGGQAPTRFRFQGEVFTENYEPADEANLDRLRYFAETRQRVRLRSDAFAFSPRGTFARIERDYGDCLIGDFEITPELGAMGVPIAVRFSFTVTALSPAHVTA